MTTPSPALNMALSQLYPNSVHDARLLNAIAAVPRARFVPEALAGAAYVDGELPLPGNRFLLDPLSFARLLQAADIQPQDKVLDVGCAYGYSTAVIAGLARQVVGCESDRAMAEAARRTLDALHIGHARVAHVNALADGYRADAPYDAIVVEGALAQKPVALLSMLAEGGRLAMVEAESPRQLGGSGCRGRLAIYTMENGNPIRKETIEMNVPLLPGATAPGGFVF